MRRPFALLVIVAALAAGCGSDQTTTETTPKSTTTTLKLASTDLDSVDLKVTDGAAPVLTFDKPFGLSETTSRDVTEGTGTAIADGLVATFDFVFVNGRDGKVITSSYESDPAQLTFSSTLMPGLVKGLAGVKAGGSVLIGIAPADGPGADEASGLRDGDTLLFYADVTDVREPLKRATGTAVAPRAGLPTVVLADDGTPTITVPKATPPTDLEAQPLIEGAGPVVEAGQTITVHYTGVLWKDGTVFDSSWESGSPATFGIGTGAVIPGWDEGLVGRKVGSQILLVVPPAKGYPEGSPDGKISATDTIVFVVDILDSH